MQFSKEYSIEWCEECEADSFEEAEKILDARADKQDNGNGINHGEITCEDKDEEV